MTKSWRLRDNAKSRKLPRAWEYARIPGDCAATRASYDACCRQAGDDGCTVVGGSIDYKGHGPLRDG